MPHTDSLLRAALRIAGGRAAAEDMVQETLLRGWRAFDRGQEVSLAYERGLTALLYVHRIVINSPLLMLSSASVRGKPLEWCRDLLFTSLHLLSSLKELIDAGVVVIVGSVANYDLQSPAADALVD